MNTQNRQMRLSQLLKNLPNLPGVYQMLSKTGEILYVGKAKSLKSRVSSYFNKHLDHPKTKALVQRIDDIETIVVHSESEALLLEQNLIKAHRPPYNVMLRDDKSYLYLFVSVDKFAKIGIGRGKAKHKQARFFGPYPSSSSAKEVLEVLQKLFLLRDCTNQVFATRQRPCLQYQIKRCSAPCVGLIDHSDYEQDVQRALQFLQGNSQALQADLIQKMHECADKMQFEQAVFYRERLAMLSEIGAKQAVYRLDGSADVFAIAQQAGLLAVNVLTVRGGKVLGDKPYFLDMPMLGDETLSETLEHFLLSFYADVSDDLPKEIIVDRALTNSQTIQTLLQTHFKQKTLIKHQVQTHRAQWLALSKLNLTNALAVKLLDYHELQQRFGQLQKVLSGVSDRAIERIECFDISHTMGELAVASCVVFDSSGAKKRDYRQYNLSNIASGDDYAAMAQVLKRRYSKHALPDLLLIDGGKGQLGVAKTVLEQLGKLKQTLLVGIAKGEGRKAGLEVLHFLHHQPIDLPADSKALHLLMYVRDEAHRFAISAHRKKRDKARGSSVLEVIPNLGVKRRRELLAHFGGMSQLLGASQMDIASVKGIGKGLASTIYKALHE